MRIILLLLSVLTVSAQDIYIHAGKIYDTNSGKLSSEKAIIISDTPELTIFFLINFLILKSSDEFR